MSWTPSQYPNDLFPAESSDSCHSSADEPKAASLVEAAFSFAAEPGSAHASDPLRRSRRPFAARVAPPACSGDVRRQEFRVRRHLSALATVRAPGGPVPGRLRPVSRLTPSGRARGDIGPCPGRPTPASTRARSPRRRSPSAPGENSDPAQDDGQNHQQPHGCRRPQRDAPRAA